MRSLTFLLSLLAFAAYAQNSIDIDAAAGHRQIALAGSFTHDWRLGKKNKIIVGIGGRATLYSGRDQYYVTAPARLTSGRTGPLVFFTDNIIANMDSVRIHQPRVVAFNTFINLGYRFNENLSAFFNIDALGLSFGSRTDGTYINGSGTSVVGAKPTAFNVLLVSDNDRGSLNSELGIKYLLERNLMLRAGMQFLFTEYTTASRVQQFPEPNDRFRKKTLMFMIGAGFVID